MPETNARTLAPAPRLGSPWIAARSIGISPKAHQELKTTLHRELLNRVDLEKLTSLEDVKARGQVQEVIHDLIGKLDTPLSTAERDKLAREVLHEVFGLGPLEPLLQDQTINDILVNTHRRRICRARRHAGEDQRYLQGRGPPTEHYR